MRFGGYAPASPARALDRATERRMLESEADALQAELDLIKKRLSEIETGAASE
jgi:prefoldin subunit 5